MTNPTVAQASQRRLIGCVGVDPGKVRSGYAHKVGTRAFQPRMIEVDPTLPPEDRLRAIRRAIRSSLEGLKEAHPEVTEWHLQVEGQYLGERDDGAGKTAASGGRFQSMMDVVVIRGYWEQAAEDLGFTVHAPLLASVWQARRGVKDMAKMMKAKSERTRLKQSAKWIAEKLLACKISSYDESDAVIICDDLSQHIGSGRSWSIKSTI